MERSGPPGPLARRNRTAARHQQLPRLHRPVVPGSVRAGVCAGHQPGSGDDQADRAGDHRQGLRRRMGATTSAAEADRANGCCGGFGAGGFGRRPATHPGGSHRHRFRARRPHRRAAALRHPGIQDGKAAS